VLIEDDLKFNQLIYKMALERAGASVTMVNNGKECLELLKRVKRGSFDVVLTDINMLEMDGVTAVRLLRRWERKLFLLANSDEGEG